jgi:hypothetical protein
MGADINRILKSDPLMYCEELVEGHQSATKLRIRGRAQTRAPERSWQISGDDQDIDAACGIVAVH